MYQKVAGVGGVTVGTAWATPETWGDGKEGVGCHGDPRPPLSPSGLFFLFAVSLFLCFHPSFLCLVLFHEASKQPPPPLSQPEFSAARLSVTFGVSQTRFLKEKSWQPGTSKDPLGPQVT